MCYETSMKNLTGEKLTPLPTGEHPWARNLRRSRKLAGWAELALSIAITVFLFKGAAERWANLTLAHFNAAWTRALVFSALLALAYGLPTLPLSFLRGYVIEKHYDLSTQSVGAWIGDQLKGLVLGAVLGTIVLLGLTATLVWTGAHWWWTAALGAMLFGIILTRVAPQWIVPLFFKMKSLEAPELQNRFKALAQKTGTPVLGIYEIDLSRRTKAANAAVIGFGASRRAIVGDTLLKEFSVDEVEFVLAHELGHHRYHDLWSGVVLSSALTLVSLGVTHLVLMRFDRFSVPFPPGPLNFNPIMIFWIAVLVSVSGSALSPLGKLFSRFVETRADEFASQATANPKAGAAAFRKLGYQNIAVFQPPRWEEALLYTHPAIARRIERLSTL